MKSDGSLDPRRAMKIHFMSQKYEFAQICSRFVAVYTRYEKCFKQIRVRSVNSLGFTAVM